MEIDRAVLVDHEPWRFTNSADPGLSALEGKTRSSNTAALHLCTISYLLLLKDRSQLLRVVYLSPCPYPDPLFIPIIPLIKPQCADTVSLDDRNYDQEPGICD